MLTVVLNPASGSSAKADEQKLVDLFGAEGVQIRTVQLQPGRGAAIIREAMADTGETMVAAGGDGTVSSVAAAVAGTNIALGVLPSGTLNHFAKDLKIPLDTAAAVKTIIARHIARVDIGYVNDRAFINNSSIGAYPGIVKVREDLKRQGHNKWLALVLATAHILRRGREVFVRVEVDGHNVITRTPFLFVGNNEYTVEGLHIGERGRLDAGRLYAYLAPRAHTRDLPKLFASALVGRTRKHFAFDAFSSADMWIETPHHRTMHVATDGEITRLATPLHYRVAAGALQVIVPAG